MDGVFASVLERPLARRLARDSRYAIPICIILICGCFAAAALLQMRLDRAHALRPHDETVSRLLAQISEGTRQ